MPIRCYGESNGLASVKLSGGKSPYSILLYVLLIPFVLLSPCFFYSFLLLSILFLLLCYIAEKIAFINIWIVTGPLPMVQLSITWPLEVISIKINWKHYSSISLILQYMLCLCQMLVAALLPKAFQLLVPPPLLLSRLMLRTLRVKMSTHIFASLPSLFPLHFLSLMFLFDQLLQLWDIE